MKYNPASSFLETDERINLKDDIWRPVLSDRFEHDASADWSFGSNEVAGVTHCGDKNYFLGDTVLPLIVRLVRRYRYPCHMISCISLLFFTFLICGKESRGASENRR